MTRLWIVALLALNVVPAFAGPDDDKKPEIPPAPTAVATRRTPQSVHEVFEGVRGEIGRVRPTALSIPSTSGPNYRRGGDTKAMANIKWVFELREIELTEVLGVYGYSKMLEMVKQIESAAGKEQPWEAIRRVLENFPDEDSMEILQAKRILKRWLQSEENQAASSETGATITLTTLSNFVEPPIVDRVLARIEEALKAANVTDAEQLFTPTAQLIAFSPYLLALTPEICDRTLRNSFEWAGDNTDKSGLELMEYYLTEIIHLKIFRSTRLNTTYGSMAAFEAGLRYWSAMTEVDENWRTPGSFLTAATHVVEYLIEHRNQAVKNGWIGEKDLMTRQRQSFRNFLMAIVTKFPDVAARLGDFPVVRYELAVSQIHENCGHLVANPIQHLQIGHE